MTEPTYTVTTLERLEQVCRLPIKTELAEYFAEPARVKIIAHAMANQLYVHVSQHVWGEELEVVELPSPADWWQAVKERWFPGWAKRRWPVRYLSHTIKLYALYPKRCYPQEESYPRVAVTTTPEYGLVSAEGYA